MENIYVRAKLLFDNKIYTGAAIGFSNELGKAERNAIKILLSGMRKNKIKEILD
jgi:hypothetical protein